MLELSMQTLAKGQALLDKLREASTHADINNSHATKAACYSVERILEALHHRRQQLDEQWKERKKVLEQCIKRCKIDEEIQKVNYSFANLLHAHGNECSPLLIRLFPFRMVKRSYFCYCLQH